MFKNMFSKSENRADAVLKKRAEQAKQEGATHIIQNETQTMQAGPSVTFYRLNAGNVEWALME